MKAISILLLSVAALAAAQSSINTDLTTVDSFNIDVTLAYRDSVQWSLEFEDSSVLALRLTPVGESDGLRARARINSAQGDADWRMSSPELVYAENATLWTTNLGGKPTLELQGGSFGSQRVRMRVDVVQRSSLLVLPSTQTQTNVVTVEGGSTAWLAVSVNSTFASVNTSCASTAASAASVVSYSTYADFSLRSDGVATICGQPLSPLLSTAGAGSQLVMIAVTAEQQAAATVSLTTQLHARASVHLPLVSLPMTETLDLQQGDMRFFNVRYPDTNVHVVATALSGDPDLYASNEPPPADATEQRRWRAEASRTSLRGGSDSLYMDGMTYLGVYGYSSTRVRLTMMDSATAIVPETLSLEPRANVLVSWLQGKLVAQATEAGEEFRFMSDALQQSSTRGLLIADEPTRRGYISADSSMTVKTAEMQQLAVNGSSFGQSSSLGHLADGRMALFELWTPPQQSLHVQLDSLSGDNDLYCDAMNNVVDYGRMLERNTYTYSSTAGGSRPDDLHLSGGEQAVHMLCAVYCYNGSPCQYALSAALYDSPPDSHGGDYGNSTHRDPVDVDSSVVNAADIFVYIMTACLVFAIVHSAVRYHRRSRAVASRELQEDLSPDEMADYEQRQAAMRASEQQNDAVDDEALPDAIVPAVPAGGGEGASGDLVAIEMGKL
eukprot:PLAT5100.1.p1 GENE.PLAT5100.1~~PLAT5100.1.p1  ORF type:complete len:678 (+),score=341.81 PLAT5100.1:31-2034(+)